MNRLILLGNGFDLAHGLRTGYNDFILWYLKRAFITAFVDGIYSDDLINIQRDGRSNYMLSYSNDVINLIDRFYAEGLQPLLENKAIKIDGYSNEYSSPFVVRIQSTLLKTLLYDCTQANWVDIENEFYDQLKSILHMKHGYSVKEDLLSSLNKSLYSLIIFLEEYLQSLQLTRQHAGYENILLCPILKEDVHGIELSENSEPDSTLIINFNYTTTMEPYLTHFHVLSDRKTPKINYIHGKVGSASTPLIFGFGDELDEAYLQMEREKAKGFFEYIKSFWYFKNSNYHDLTRYIDADAFQAVILGHSCGLSDRTMLHMIFEHPNCKSIRIYFHGDKNGINNYTTLTHEIARHFKDKAEMRNKIVPLDRSEPMPQVS